MTTLWILLKRAGTVALALAALYLIGNAVLIWYTGSRLEERLQAVRDAGDPVSLKDLARTRIPPDQNAVTFLRRARADMTAVLKELTPIQVRDGPRSEADVKAVRAALEAYPNVFPLLERAADCPDYDSELDYTSGTDALLTPLMDQVQKMREAASLFSERARLQIADGKRDEAVQSAVTILRLAHHLEREPILISHLVVCACRAVGVDAANRALRAGPVSAKARAALDAELARADNVAAYVWTLKSDRAYAAEVFRTNSCINWFNRAYFNDDQCYHMDLIAAHIALAPRTSADSRAAEEKLREESQSWRHRLSNLVTPALEKVHEAEIRVRALVRCLRVLNALQQKPAAAATAAPKLADLGLPAAATVDPYNGAPLLIRKVAGEWVVYAVGRDLNDDGGQVAEFKDVGVGPVPAGER